MLRGCVSSERIWICFSNWLRSQGLSAGSVRDGNDTCVIDASEVKMGTVVESKKNAILRMYVGIDRFSLNVNEFIPSQFPPRTY